MADGAVVLRCNLQPAGLRLVRVSLRLSRRAARRLQRALLPWQLRQGAFDPDALVEAEVPMLVRFGNGLQLEFSVVSVRAPGKSNTSANLATCPPRGARRR